MKFGNLALFVSALASVALGHVVNIPNAHQQRSVQQGESVLSARFQDEAALALALADRAFDQDSLGYTFLKKAAGGRTLERGQQHAIKERAPGLKGHAKVIVGIVAHSTNKAGTRYEFSNAR